MWTVLFVVSLARFHATFTTAAAFVQPSSSDGRRYSYDRQLCASSHGSISGASTPAIDTENASSHGRTNAALPLTQPLPRHTFAGMVEHALVNRFTSSSGTSDSRQNIDRILESWRLLDRNHVHEAFVGDSSLDPAVSKCHQLCHSYVPGLTAREFWDPSTLDWCTQLQGRYAAIRDEFTKVALNDMEGLSNRGNNIWAGALTEDAANSYGRDWKTLVLMNRGVWDPVNVNLFPVTAQAVRDAQVPVVEVFFASMQPHSVIQPHTDFTNFVLTCHLPIDIPYSGQNKCRLSVGDTERQWHNGELLLFDTSIRHDAVNESDLMRYILMLRVWHPDLSEVERQALQFTFNALEEPGLVSDNDAERAAAERVVQAALAFPTLDSIRKRGFGSGATSGSKKDKKGRR